MGVRCPNRAAVIAAALALCALCSCDALAPDLADWSIRHPPIISLSAGSLAFTAMAGGGDPGSRVVRIKIVGGESLTGLSASVSYELGQPACRLSVELRSTSAPTSMVVHATTGALQPDALTAAIFVSPSVDGVWRKGLPVSLMLSGP